MTRLAVSALILTTSVARADDWPQWRGPTADGISREAGVLTKWPAGGPPVAWTAKNLGVGFGAPSVAGGKVYGVGSRDGKDGVWALNEESGSELWFTPFAGTPRVGKQTNGPAGTPTVAGGKLYAVSLGGTFACLDAKTGEQLWTKDYLKDYGAGLPAWGFSESVLVDGGVAYGAPGGPKAAVVAFDAATGKELWKADLGPVGGGAGYSTPVKATVKGVPMIVVLLGTKAGIVGLDPKTGKLLWQYTKAALGGIAQIPTPIIRGDKVWFSTSYSGGSALLQLEPSDGGTFTVKELKTYKKPDLNNHHGGMVLVGDHVYFGHDQNQGHPVCVNFETGEIAWGPERSNAKVGGGQGSAAVTVAGGKLIFRYQNSVMALIEPSPEELKVIGTFKLPPADVASFPQSWPHPVVANGRLYVRDQNVLYAYDARGK